MRKRLLTVLICLCMVTSLFACKKKEEPSDVTTPTPDTTTQAPAEPTKAPDTTPAPVGEALPDPVYYYSFDKADGTTGIVPAIKDSAATPIVQNVPDKEIVFVDGVKGDAIYADGSTGFKLTDVNGVGDTYTISFWVNPSRCAQYMPSVQFGPDIHGDLTGGQHYVNFTWADWSGSREFPCVWTYHQLGDEAVVWPNWFPETGDTRVKVWSNITMVVDPANTTDEGSNLVAKVYLNGELFGEPTIVTGTMSPSDNFEMLLGLNYWDETYKGAFDEFYVFNETLTEGQVKTLFELGNANATYNEPEHVFEFYKEEGAVESLGADNFVSPFMSTVSKAYRIADGETWQIKLHNWSDGNDTQNNYALVLANAENGAEGYTEYAVVRADASGYTPAGDIPASAFTYTWGNWNTWAQKVMRDSDTTLKITRNGSDFIVEASNVDYNENPNNMTATFSTAADGDCVFYLTCQNAWVDILNVKDMTVREGGITVGNTDRTTPWWSAFSNIFAVPEGESVTKTFTNFTNGAENWTNFVAILQSTPTGHSADTEGYSEYAVVRADNFGWGAGYDNIATAECDWNWDTFKADMDGAKISVTITNNGSTADIAILATTEAGKVYHQNYYGIAITGDLYACFSCEGSYLQFDTLTVGKTDRTTGWWTEFSDIIEIPADGRKTVYFKNYTNGVENWNNFVAILQNVPGAHSADGIPIYSEYAVVRADNFGWGTGYDGIATAECDWNWDTFKSDMDGAYIELTVTNYVGEGANVLITATTAEGKQYHQTYKGIAVDGPLYLCLSCEGSYIEIEKERVGAIDRTTPFWSKFSNIWFVPEGVTVSKSLTNYTNGAENWCNFCAVLQSTPEGHAPGDNAAGIWPVDGYGEYAVVRADNFGWGAGYDGIATADCDWNWDTFKEDMDGASVNVAVTNNGSTADIFITTTTKAGKVYSQSYSNIAVTGEVYLTFLCEGAYLLVE